MAKTILLGKRRRIIAMDSASFMEECYQGDIIVCGSHGGASAAKHMLKFSPGGAIFNDAGKGKEDAGMAALAVFSEAGLPAATVDAFSARIGDGMDTYDSGVISAVNQEAAACGVRVSSLAREAALKILERKEQGQ
ncbi:MAG: hypothetical protein HZA01_00955 [Nitrospinae bacterium]|nr:hypothetical protein [Nitrospinota bacterium]